MASCAFRRVGLPFKHAVIVLRSKPVSYAACLKLLNFPLLYASTVSSIPRSHSSLSVIVRFRPGIVGETVERVWWWNVLIFSVQFARWSVCVGGAVHCHLAYILAVYTRTGRGSTSHDAMFLHRGSIPAYGISKWCSTPC